MEAAGRAMLILSKNKAPADTSSKAFIAFDLTMYRADAFAYALPGGRIYYHADIISYKNRFVKCFSKNYFEIIPTYSIVVLGE